MAQRKCKVCSKPYRAGQLVYVGGEGGTFMRAVVCPSCAKKAIALLPTVASSRCGCGNETATMGAVCAQKAIDKAVRESVDTKALSKMMMLRSRVYRAHSKDTPGDSEYSEGIAAGLEQAANFLEKGNWT